MKVTEETEQITDIEVIRAMLTEFVAENNLDARIVSDKEYPGYQPVVVAFQKSCLESVSAACSLPQMQFL